MLTHIHLLLDNYELSKELKFDSIFNLLNKNPLKNIHSPRFARPFLTKWVMVSATKKEKKIYICSKNCNYYKNNREQEFEFYSHFIHSQIYSFVSCYSTHIYHVFINNVITEINIDAHTLLHSTKLSKFELNQTFKYSMKLHQDLVILVV